MSKHTFNQVYKKQNAKLLPATFKRGTISAINIGARTADVCFVQNPQTVIRSIRLASNIVVASLKVGQQVGVDTYNETSPNSMVISSTF